MEWIPSEIRKRAAMLPHLMPNLHIELIKKFVLLPELSTGFRMYTDNDLGRCYKTQKCVDFDFLIFEFRFCIPVRWKLIEEPTRKLTREAARSFSELMEMMRPKED
jgi:hypothetical protein